MKITKDALRRIIREELNRALNEEAHDCYQDYKAGGLSWEEYQDCLKRFADDDDYDSPRPGSFDDTWSRDRWADRESRSDRRWRRRGY